MDITVVYVDGCPHVALARSRVAKALRHTAREGGVHEQLVRLGDDPAEAGLFGSPRILVDGRDPFPGGIPGYACLLYVTGDGTQARHRSRSLSTRSTLPRD